MAMMLAFSNQAFSQEGDGIYFKTVFVAKDAVGNTDTVVFYVKEGATSGIDTALGEVNLFGQAITKDLDLRIIQRNTINCVCAEWNFWLCPSTQMFEWDSIGITKCFFIGDFVFPSKENIDLKVDYRNDSLAWDIPEWEQQKPNSYVLKVSAKHYPVSGYADSFTQGLGGVKNIYTALFNEEDGLYVENSFRYHYSNWAGYIEPGELLRTFNDASENNLVWVNQIEYVSIEDAMEQPPLYPNPASEFIIIEEGRFGEAFTISDINGKTVKIFTVENYPYSVDIRDLIRGTYFLKNREGTTIYSFIKEN